MTIDATFWVAVSFFIFIGALIYLKVPQKINSSLADQINEIKNDLDEAEKLKEEAKNLLSDYESKIDKSKNETKEIIILAKKDSEKNILDKTKKFYEIIDRKKKNIELKITQMKKNALKEIRNISIKTSVEAAEHLIRNSVDKKKLENFYSKSLIESKTQLKSTNSVCLCIRQHRYEEGLHIKNSPSNREKSWRFTLEQIAYIHKSINYGK